ncbi:MAG: flagellar type III secretion system pore protein FliP [Candidatus Binatia bacterium]|nr:flagellar type III secretion system pore protein FliP [Candidatus Binatia bacterium]
MNPDIFPRLGESVAKGTEVSTALEILFLLTLLSLGPFLLITLTSFTRIVIVLSFLRQALGTQQSPSNHIILALALFLSFYVMAPVWQRIESDAVVPYLQRRIGPQEALTRAWHPLREFLRKQTRPADLALFAEMRSRQAASNPAEGVSPGGGEGKTENIEETAVILLPAFMISELKTAFQMAFLLYVPFLVLDLVVAAVLMSMGMMFLPPVLVSLPFKLVLFVLVDGWNLLVESLVRSFV